MPLPPLQDDGFRPPPVPPPNHSNARPERSPSRLLMHDQSDAEAPESASDWSCMRSRDGERSGRAFEWFGGGTGGGRKPSSCRGGSGIYHIGRLWMKRVLCLAALGTACWAAPAIYAQAEELAAVEIEWVIDDASAGADILGLADDQNTLELAQGPGRRGEGPGAPGGPRGPGGMDPERARALRERLQKMSPEERQKAIGQIRLHLQGDRAGDKAAPEAKKDDDKKSE